MCSINIAINGELSDVCRMSQATKSRGLKSFTVKRGNAFVSFNHLPTTDQTFQNGYETENYHVWLNGFISNHKELAVKYHLDLESERDTEVLAKLMELDINFRELNGFFAIAFYSKKHNRFSFITDRYGIKQLYKHKQNGITYISSEVKGILSVCQNIELDKQAVKDWQYSLGVMTENTIYKGIKRVECLPLRIPTKINISYEDAKNKLVSLLGRSFTRNKSKQSDCVFLSGGIDSGIIAKYIDPKYCFSMDYQYKKYSEIENIKLNSEGKHITMICNEQLFNDNKHKAIQALDDLKAGSCYTNYAITELASKFCTIIYSGAGGDEFFGGYPHRQNKSINEVIRRDQTKELKNYDISHFDYDLRFLKAVLVVEDRMGGAHTMETRYPLLDNDLVDFALSLPKEYLKNKKILRDISGLDQKVLNSPKKGFSNPYCNNKEWVEFTLKNLKRYD